MCVCGGGGGGGGGLVVVLDSEDPLLMSRNATCSFKNLIIAIQGLKS